MAVPLPLRDDAAHPPPLPDELTGGSSRLRSRLALLRHPGCVAGYLEGHAHRRLWAARLRAGGGKLRAVRPAGRVEADVLSFSSERDVPEQAASIRSFLHHAGRPLRWTVASDGTHTPESRALLAALDPCVEVLDWQEAGGAAAPEPLRRCAERHPLGKKLALVAGRPVERTTIFSDSDVLFLPGARDLAAEVAAETTPRFQLDCFDVLDRRLVPADERSYPTNTGFLVLPASLDWSRAAALVDEQLADPEFFVAGAWAEQAATHLALRDSGARPLDPERYVIRGDDYLRYRDVGATPAAVLRHYAGPTRYMMWMQVRRFEAGAGQRWKRRGGA